jgi:hypothetical protein
MSIMSQDRALFWLSVVALMGLGISLGQVEAVSVAAMAGIILVYLQTKSDAPPPGQNPS